MKGYFPWCCQILYNSIHILKEKGNSSSVFSFVFQVRALYKSSHKKVSHRRRAVYVKKCVAGTKLLFLLIKPIAFDVLVFFVVVVWHFIHDETEVKSILKTTTTKLLQKE